MDIFTSFIDIDTKEEILSNTCKPEEIELIFKVDRTEIEDKEYRVKKKVYSLCPDRTLKIYITNKSAVNVMK